VQASKAVVRPATKAANTGNRPARRRSHQAPASKPAAKG
jgi:hypothetical protein